MSGLIRILTVDVHAIFREGLATVRATQPDMKLVAAASNGREAIQEFRAHWPDIVGNSFRIATIASRPTLIELQMPLMA